MSQIVEPAPEVSVRNALLGTKAVRSLECFMDGVVEYYLQIPSWPDDTPRPLVIVSDFFRESRPLAWKSCDLKIQSTLPILGMDEITQKAMVEPHRNMQLVKVTLKLS
jgi:hypothetical protein